MIAPSSKIWIGFTSYRSETLPFTEKQMKTCDAVVLEEPHTPGFQEMLQKELAIDEYLMLSDFGFPDYALRSCQMMQRLFAEGIVLYQIDPFMDELVRIHEFFASGGSPKEIIDQTVTMDVYLCERHWTQKLILFYKDSCKTDFDLLVSAVKEFAKADAKKGNMRNRMRAEEIVQLFSLHDSIYIEAGYIHFILFQELLHRKTNGVSIKPVYPMAEVTRALTGRKQILAPGDQLTFLYTFHPEMNDSRTDTLAAQSLIYNKIVNKEEIVSSDELYPHTLNEIQSVSLASSLQYTQCRDIFSAIRHLETFEAREYLIDWRKKHGG
jgi:hypothetical protein